MADKNIVSKEGLLDSQKELEERKTLIRKQIADDIEKAREQGDLSENAAYKAAIEQNQFNEKKILDLEDFIKNALVIEENTNKSQIGLGSVVKVSSKDTKKELVFEIVGQNEADPSSKKISSLSPLGKAMIGKKVNDDFIFFTPSGNQLTYKVLEIK